MRPTTHCPSETGARCRRDSARTRCSPTPTASAKVANTISCCRKAPRQNAVPEGQVQDDEGHDEDVHVIARQRPVAHHHPGTAPSRPRFRNQAGNPLRPPVAALDLDLDTAQPKRPCEQQQAAAPDAGLSCDQLGDGFVDGRNAHRVSVLVVALERFGQPRLALQKVVECGSSRALSTRAEQRREVAGVHLRRTGLERTARASAFATGP